MSHHLSPVRRRLALAVLGLAASAPLASVCAQTAYPARPIKLVVGYAPGGSVDMAAGVVATQLVVTSAPDGYTLMVGSSNELAATGLVNPAQKYDPLTDLTALGLIATTPVLLVAGPKTNVKNLDAFFALVKRHPGKFSYGTSGVGSTLHFAGELVKQRAGLFMTHIPYRGTAALTSDLVGGSLDFGIVSPTAAAPFLQSQRFTVLGVTSAKRFATLPQVPALGEHPLLKGYELSGWFALAAPKGLPPEIIQRLNAAMKASLAEPAFRRRLEDGGTIPATGGEDLARVMREDMEKYRQLVKFANMRD